MWRSVILLLCVSLLTEVPGCSCFGLVGEALEELSSIVTLPWEEVDDPDVPPYMAFGDFGPTMTLPWEEVDDPDVPPYMAFGDFGPTVTLPSGPGVNSDMGAFSPSATVPWGSPGGNAGGNTAGGSTMRGEWKGNCWCKEPCEVYLGRNLCYVSDPDNCDAATPSIRESHQGQRWLECPTEPNEDACKCKESCEVYMGESICYVSDPDNCAGANLSTRESHLGKRWVYCPGQARKSVIAVTASQP